jgi:hypothetical protein
VLVRTPINHDTPVERARSRNVHPLVSLAMLLAAMGLGVGLLTLIIYLAVHTDMCHLAEMRCAIPRGLLTH